MNKDPKNPNWKQNSSFLQAQTIMGLDELSGTWLMEPRAARAMMLQINQLARMNWDLAAFYGEDSMQAKHLGDADERSETLRLVDENVTMVGMRAIVEIRGVLMKRPPISRMFGRGGMSYREIALVMTELGGRSDVEEIWLHIDSPGGSFAGVVECGDVIYRVRQQKPVHTFGEDLLASGAYWLGCQAQDVFVNSGTITGSVGVYTILVDDTGHDAQLGIKRVTVSTGGVKGLGADGDVNQQLVDETQRLAHELGHLFTSAVARGRGITVGEAEDMADGKVHVGESAVKHGFADGIISMRDVYHVESIQLQNKGVVVMNKGKEVDKKDDVEESTNSVDEGAQSPVTKETEILARLGALESSNDELTRSNETLQRSNEQLAVSNDRLVHDREQRNVKVQQEMIEQAVATWVTDGRVVPVHVEPLSGLLQSMRESGMNVEIPGDGDEPHSVHLFEHGIQVLNDVLTAQDLIVDYGERSSAHEADGNETSAAEASGLLKRMGIASKTEVANNGS